MSESSMLSYDATAEELVNRIVKLIPLHPEILDIEDCWGLFKVKGFSCRDLQPSLFQAQWALSKAKQIANSSSQKG